MKGAADSRPGSPKWAWERVSGVGESDSEYLTEARKLPARLLSSGLGQTVAFLYSKGAKKTRQSDVKGRALLYKHIDTWVRENHRSSPAPVDQCMNIIVGLSATQYRLMTRELLATAEWIKRFAEGHITGDKQDGAGSK